MVFKLIIEIIIIIISINIFLDLHNLISDKLDSFNSMFETLTSFQCHSTNIIHSDHGATVDHSSLAY